MKTVVVLFATVTALGATAPAMAQSGEGRFALGVNAGTTGLGVEGQFRASERFVLRGGFDTLKFDQDVDGDDLQYAGEIDFSTAGAFVDFHPMRNAFFVTGGAYFGNREVSVSGTPAAGTNVEIGDETFTAAQVGTLRGSLDFGDSAPFLGFGWNNTFTTDNRVGFQILFGAAFGSDPDASLTRVGGSALSPSEQARFDSALRVEEQEIEDSTDGLTIYPVVRVGLSLRF